MVALVELNNMRLAHDLVRARLRLSIVRGLTGVGTKTLRQWWKEIHGVRPPNGKLPETVLSFIRSAETAAVISAYSAFYMRLCGHEVMPASGLFTTWLEFNRFFLPIDINAAYFAIRDLRARIVVLARCSACSAVFIYDVGNTHTECCPFCKTKAVAGH